MPTCHLCFNLKFKNWIDYHDHYQEHHLNNTWRVDSHFNIVRRKAIATSLNVSGRTKKQIVDDCEANTWLKEYIV
jgi:hypothetical protein